MQWRIQAIAGKYAFDGLEYNFCADEMLSMLQLWGTPTLQKPEGLRFFLCNFGVHANVAKTGGLQSQGAKGAAVVSLLQALGNVGSGVLRLSRRVKRMA